MNEAIYINIANEIGPRLGLRISCDRLFDRISSMDADIVIDFAGVETISRSFAHQYLLRKKELKDRIRITEVNMPDNIKRMFDVVMTARKTSIDVKTVKIDIRTINY